MTGDSAKGDFRVTEASFANAQKQFDLSRGIPGFQEEQLNLLEGR